MFSSRIGLEETSSGRVVDQKVDYTRVPSAWHLRTPVFPAVHRTPHMQPIATVTSATARKNAIW